MLDGRIQISSVQIFIINLLTMSTTQEVKQTQVKPAQEEPHVHGQHCSHDHHHEHQHDEGTKSDSDSDDGVTDPNKKSSRSEKKFKKAMVKLGLKPLTGVNRVTVKKGKDFMVSIDNPEILKSQNTYVVFGKVNMDDGAFGGKRTFQEYDSKQPTVVKEEAPSTPAENAPQAQSAEDLNEQGLNPDNIKMVMEYTKCTKAAAIKALRETGDDSVNAIMKITG